MEKKHVTAEAMNLQAYETGIENLKKRGFKLVDQTVAWDLWETENTRYFVKKSF